MNARRLRNAAFIFLMLLAAYLLQYSVIAMIPDFSRAPNLMLIVAFSFAYYRGSNMGMIVGFFAGLVTDVFFSDIVGVSALMFVIIGLACGTFGKMFYADNIVTPMLMLMLSAAAYDLVYFFFWFVLRSNFEFGYIVLHSILPELLLTFVFGVALIKPMSFFIRKMYAYADALEEE